MQKKIQQNVAVKSKNQILSIKKFRLTISSEDGKGRRPRMEEKSGRQLALEMKAISLSTLQRKTGRSQAVAPKLSLTLVSQLSAVLPDNLPSEAAGVLRITCLPVSRELHPQQEGSVAVKDRAGLRLASDQMHSKG